MVVDHSEDYLTWDNTEAGTIELQNDAVTVTIGIMLRGPWKHQAFGEPVALEGNLIAFSIPQKLLNPTALGRIIARNDVIVGSDAVRFTVVHAELSMCKSHWYCGALADQTG